MWSRGSGGRVRRNVSRSFVQRRADPAGHAANRDGVVLEEKVSAIVDTHRLPCLASVWFVGPPDLGVLIALQTVVAPPAQASLRPVRAVTRQPGRIHRGNGLVLDVKTVGWPSLTTGFFTLLPPFFTARTSGCASTTPNATGTGRRRPASALRYRSMSWLVCPVFRSHNASVEFCQDFARGSCRKCDLVTIVSLPPKSVHRPQMGNTSPLARHRFDSWRRRVRQSGSRLGNVRRGYFRYR